ncbi:DUF2156 domain-containing protein [Candidatus Margulisiibacteriota bacterium]
MLPEYPNFKTLELEDIKLLRRLFHKANPQVCELALANLFIWQDFDHAKLTMINHNLCLLITPPNEPPFFLEPIGNNKIRETVDICLKDTGKLARVSETFLPCLPTNNYHVTCDRNQFDYVYETKTLAELKGKKFDGKRNHIKNFKKRHANHKFVPLTLEHKKEALRLFEEWFAVRKESRHFPKLAHDSQKNAVNRAFEYFEQLKLIGGAIFVDQEMKGFVLGSPLNKETAAVHFLYAHPALRGIFQTILWEACNKTFSGYKYVNLEQDLGIPGLRKAKLSNYPVKLEKKFEVTPK